jgi:hypothetical protein
VAIHIIASAYGWPKWEILELEEAEIIDFLALIYKEGRRRGIS